jgi:hypothetical protein
LYIPAKHVSRLDLQANQSSNCSIDIFFRKSCNNRSQKHAGRLYWLEKHARTFEQIQNQESQTLIKKKKTYEA